VQQKESSYSPGLFPNPFVAYFQGRDLLKKLVRTSIYSALLLFVLTFFVLGGTAFAASTSGTSQVTPARFSYQRACTSVAIGYARCSAMVAKLVGSSNAMAVNPFANPTGGAAPYKPADLHRAYNLPTTASGTPTVAIVDAFNDPNAESDMNSYRSMFGIPSCTSASGCFRKVNQNGATSPLPSNNTGWGVEISLDLDMASAICQNCHILLVEANSASLAALGAAVNTAARLGAVAISNSYGTNEFSGETSNCSSFYQHNNVAVTASSGDGGPAVEFPAVCPTVVGVGGTALQTNGTETAWNTNSTEGAGGGCSRFVARQSWESSSVTGCSRHAVSTVSAVADPATGVFVFDTFGEPGGLQVGGTSASSPIIAAVYALAGHMSTTQNAPTLPWGHRTAGCLFTVSGRAYAFQTGLGTPNGTGCF
jgi:subtilase family serine protease